MFKAREGFEVSCVKHEPGHRSSPWKPPPFTKRHVLPQRPHSRCDDLWFVCLCHIYCACIMLLWKCFSGLSGSFIWDHLRSYANEANLLRLIKPLKMRDLHQNRSDWGYFQGHVSFFSLTLFWRLMRACSLHLHGTLHAMFTMAWSELLNTLLMTSLKVAGLTAASVGGEFPQ